MASKGFLFYLLCVLPVAMAHNTNGTVNGSVVLSCVLKTSGPINPARLRFHWEEVNSLSRLYVFEKGKLMPERASKTYRNRTTASVQDMRSGNISVTLNNLTLEDDGSSFWAFAVLFEEHDASLRQDFEKICQTALHVAVPYQEPNLTVNEDKTAATCRTRGGFPEPVLTWRGYNISVNTDHPLQPKEKPTIDQQGGLYSITSTITITGPGYHSLTCLITNPTSNVTLSASVTITEVGLQLSGWVIALIVVGVVVLLAVLLAVYVMWKKYVGQRDLSGWVIAGLVVRGVDVIAVVLLDVYAIWKKHVEQQDLSDWATAGLVVAVVLLAAAVVFDVYVIWKKHMGHQDVSPGIIIGFLVCLVLLAAAALLDVYVIWKKRVGQKGLSGGDIAGFVVRGVRLLAVVALPVVILIVYSGWTRYVVQLGITIWDIGLIVFGFVLLAVVLVVCLILKIYVVQLGITIWDIIFIVFGFALLAVVLVVCLILKKCGNRNQRPATANDSAAAVRADASPTRSTDVVHVPLMEQSAKPSATSGTNEDSDTVSDHD